MSSGDPKCLADRARWLVVAVLACAGGFVLSELFRGQDPAFAQQATVPIQSGARVVALPGQLTAETFGVYLVDLEHNTLAVYQYLPGTTPGSRKLRFLAARNFTWDLQLEEYNTEQSPREIRQLVEQQQRRDAATTSQ